jgi:hypothetical protein
LITPLAGIGHKNKLSIAQFYSFLYAWKEIILSVNVPCALGVLIEIVVNSRRRMHLYMQDDQNGEKMMVLTSAEETRLTCFILLQNIFSEVINIV